MYLQLEEYGKGHAGMLQERTEYEEEQRRVAQENLHVSVLCVLPRYFCCTTVQGEMVTSQICVMPLLSYICIQ
jgi:hypothetical protein